MGRSPYRDSGSLLITADDDSSNCSGSRLWTLAHDKRSYSVIGSMVTVQLVWREMQVAMDWP